jgi:gluconokinase
MSVPRILVMGVAGSGKSTLASRLAGTLHIPFIEGDDHHSPGSRDKMRRGIALRDGDRTAWLDTLAAMLASQDGGAALACSALRRSYRDRFRGSVPDIRILFLDMDAGSAYARVAARPTHLFPPSLVRSQFEALEPPLGEPDVLRVDANLSTLEQLDVALAWLAAPLGGVATSR